MLTRIVPRRMALWSILAICICTCIANICTNSRASWPHVAHTGPSHVGHTGFRLEAATCLGTATACTLAEAPPSSSPQRSVYSKIADEVERHLLDQVLPFWFPRCVDRERGGFRSQFDAQGKLGPQNEKTIVFQARMTWLAAEVAQRFPDLATAYRDYATHGLEFLKNTLWDSEHGGFYWGLDENGQLTPAYGAEKHLYGISFGLYAASNVHRATGDPEALRLAQETFRWLEKHAYDREHGGYWEAFTRDGTPLTSRPEIGANGRANAARDLLGTPYGFKSMNSHIHILEALTELHRAWPEAEVAARLRDVFLIVRDKIAVEPGCLNLYFTPDWRPVPDHDSFGHDVETAFLLLEAAEQLHLENDPTTLQRAKQLVDHALQYGWDQRLGGFYDLGTAFGPACKREKIWWTQAEGLNGLLLMHARFGAQDGRYWPAFVKQWEFIKNYQIDPKMGEWFDTVSPQGKPLPKDLGHIWKAAYHNGRALMESAVRLRRFAQPPEKQAGENETPPVAQAAPPLERVQVSPDGRGFVLVPSGREFVPWGVNYDHDQAGRLLEDYWHEEWDRVAGDFREIKALGANVVRIHLQTGRFVAAPDRANGQNLAQLRKLLRLAEEVGLYLDITGLGCYHRQDTPAWYDQLDEPGRWAVQAFFWRSIAKTVCDSPAVFCYDLMNEPVVPGEKRPPEDWLVDAELGGKYFVQRITLDPAGRPRQQIAQEWASHLERAIREVDAAGLITIGLLPGTKDRADAWSGFVPDQLLPPLDFICVHIYPESKKLDESLQILSRFAVGRPVVIEEFFPLRCSGEEAEQFLAESRRYAQGWISFYWGTPIEELRQAKELGPHLVAAWLEQFQKLGPRFRRP